MTFRSCQVCQQRIKGLYFHFLLAVAYQIPFVAISKDKKNLSQYDEFLENLNCFNVL